MKYSKFKIRAAGIIVAIVGLAWVIGGTAFASPNDTKYGEAGYLVAGAVVFVDVGIVGDGNDGQSKVLYGTGPEFIDTQINDGENNSPALVWIDDVNAIPVVNGSNQIDVVIATYVPKNLNLSEDNVSFADAYFNPDAYGANPNANWVSMNPNVWSDGRTFAANGQISVNFAINSG